MVQCIVKGCTNHGLFYNRKCASHTTCQSYSCKNEKNPDNKYCDACKCVVDKCQKQKTFHSSACYDHNCTRCGKIPYKNDDKLCDICHCKCIVYDCKRNRLDNCKYCADHVCIIDGCTNPCYSFMGKYEKYCSELHVCHRCKNIRNNPDDSNYCVECLSECFDWKCKIRRPSQHKGRFYYCDEHGCLECQQSSKHSFYFMREQIKSEFCKDHYLCKEEGCKWYRIFNTDFCTKHSF